MPIFHVDPAQSWARVWHPLTTPKEWRVIQVTMVIFFSVQRLVAGFDVCCTHMNLTNSLHAEYMSVPHACVFLQMIETNDISEAKIKMKQTMEGRTLFKSGLKFLLSLKSGPCSDSLKPRSKHAPF